MVTPVPRFSQQTFLLSRADTMSAVSSSVTAASSAFVTATSSSSVTAASGVDWSQVHAVRLLGVALAALILLWAIRRMFGRKK
jgi:hypothetical protein